MSPEESRAYLERLRKQREAKQTASSTAAPTNTPAYQTLKAAAESGKPLPPDEFESLLEQLKKQNAALKTAQTPVTPKPPAKHPYILKLEAERAARLAATPKAAQQQSITPEEGKTVAKKSEFTLAAADTQAAATKLRNQLAAKYANSPMTEEEKRNRIEAEMSELAQPIYVGGFEGPIRSYGGLVSPSIIPEGAKAAEGISGVGSVLEVLKPKVEIPETTVAANVDDPFDDLKFNESIKDLPASEQAQSRASYNAFKKVYNKYRETFPSISSGGILDMVKNKIQDIPNKKIIFDPVAGGYENPLLRAVQTQGTTGTLYDLDEIQSDYFRELAKELIPFQTQQLRNELSNKTKTVATKDRTGNVVSTKEVKLTPDEIEAEVQRRIKSGEIGGTEIFTDKEKMRQFLQDPNKFATRTWTGGLEFPGGATVESPAMWFVRAATAIPNVIAGAAGFSLGTALGVQEAREAGREEKQKPAGEGIAAGLASNIAANLAEAGGYGKELADIVRYNPNPSINQYENLARIAGTAVDLIGFGDIAPIAGVAGAARGAMIGKAATAAAGVKGLESLSDIAAIAAKTGAADYLNSLPLIGKMAEKVTPADVRIVYGSRLADEIDEVSYFAKTYDSNIAKGLSKEEALRATLSEGRANTSFYNKAKALAPDDARKLADDTLKSVPEFKNYDDIAAAADKWKAGDELTSAEQKLIAPYIKRSSAASKQTGDLLNQFVREIKDISGRVDLNRAPRNVRLGLASVIKHFARLDIATKQIDDALSAAGLGLGLKGLKGNQLKALSRNVIASEDVINKTIAKFKDSNFYKTIIKPEKKVVDVVYKGNVETAYDISDEMKQIIARKVSESRIGNKLIESDAVRISDLLANNKITANDLKLLSDLEVEAIALNRGAIAKEALATEKLIPVTTTGSRQLKISVAQENRLKELTSDTPVIVSRKVKSMSEAFNRIKKLVSPYQQTLIDNAMREIGALPQRLKSEINRINTDEQFAALYGVTKDSNIEEKILALARGAYANADEASKAAVSPVFVDELLKSMLFGANRNRLTQIFSPGYDYGIDVLEDTADFLALKERLLKYTPQQISNELENIAAELNIIVKNNTNIKLQEISGTEAFAVSKDRVKEVSASVYGRMKANEIKTKTLNKILEETTFELSDATKKLNEAFRRPDMPAKPNKLLVSVKKLKEAINTDKQLFTQLERRYRENRTVAPQLEIDAKLNIQPLQLISKIKKDKDLFNNLYQRYKSISISEGGDVPPIEAVSALDLSNQINLRLNDYSDILSKSKLSTEYIPANSRGVVTADMIVSEIEYDLDSFVDILSNKKLADINELEPRKPYPQDMMNKIFYSLIAADVQYPWIDNLISNPMNIDGELVDLFKNSFEQFGVKTFDNEKVAAALSNLFKLEASRTIERTAGDIIETGTSRGILEDLQVSRQKLLETNGLNNQQVYNAFKRLADGKLDINQFAAPALVDEFQKSLGVNANYKNMLRELAITSQQAAEGNVSAFTTIRRIDQLINTFHTTFYNAALYVRPSFHGVNNFSAALQQAYTTGRVPVIADVMRGNMPGAIWTKSAQIVTEASSIASPAIRNRIAVTDKFGNSYTYGQMHDLAINKGLFVTRAKAELSPSFLSDINELFKGPMSKYASQANFLSRDFAGSQFASYTDRIWRMTSVIDGLQEGKTIDEAFELGRKSLYDYNNITDFERNFVAPIARRAFVFYNYKRQSIGQFMSNLASNPARVIRMMRLSKDTTDVMIGDQNARDLSFYFDPNYATSSIVLKMKTGATRNQGEIISSLALPTQDGINFASGVLANPVGFLIGSEYPAKPGRSFEGTTTAEMLSPIAKMALAIAAGKSIVSSQKLTKNYIPPEHMVLFRLAGVDSHIMDYYQVKVVDSTDKENSLDGKSFYVDDENFESYKVLVVASETTGVKSAMTYYGRLIGSPSLSGAYPKTVPAFLGLTPTTGAQIKEAAQTRAMQEQAKEFEQQTQSTESYRFR